MSDASLSLAVLNAAKDYNTVLANAEEAIRTAQTALTAACDAAQLASLTMSLTGDDGTILSHPVGAIGYDPFLGRIRRVVVSRAADL